MSESERERQDQALTSGDDRNPIERAEVIVDRLGARLGEVAAVAGFELRRAAERAREETEDIWAEARDLRARWRGDHDNAR
jgi:hypothetical protein